jgi:KUP system potassium uptake protein
MEISDFGSNESSQERYAARAQHSGPLHLLALGALGIVYGDIGTSPLYAFKTCVQALGVDVSGGVEVAVVLGLLSLVFWAITLVVTLKYVGIVMNADNRGEGGVLALTALVVHEGRPKRPWLLAALGLAGCAFFYGDGTITPAVSVLSAIEGLQLVYPDFGNWVIYLSVIVLVALFAGQRHGTGSIGRLFGPVMLVWFGVIGFLGAVQIVQNPVVLLAVNPYYAVTFLLHHPAIGGAVASAVFLAVTGGEALYADLGHFGKKPIRLAWFVLVWPALILNYFGQGALILSDPKLASDPFYYLAPHSLLIPLVVLATAATIIASQAVISGVFSMTQQALQLGFLPRMKVLQTSDEAIGQIYVPAVNTLLGIATVGLVLTFRSSDALAGAYGIAVVCTMLITSILIDVLLAHRLRKDRNAGILLAFSLPLGLLDLTFMLTNVEKIPQGGWFPLLCGLIVFVTMRSWMRGRKVVEEQTGRHERPVKTFLDDLERSPVTVVPGTAVFMTSRTGAVPSTLTRNVRSNGVLHEHTVLLSIVTERIPRVARGGRLKVARLARQLWSVEIHIGFVERADVPRLLREAERLGLGFRTDDATYFLGRDDIVLSSPRGMATWRKRLFAFMARNAEFAGTHYSLPPERIIELGGQVEI